MEYDAFVIIVAVVVAVLIFSMSSGRRHAGRIEQRLCRSCGAAHPPFAQYCRRCGQRL